MKIIALEEHIGSQLLGDATRDAIVASYPYYNTFLHPDPADAPSIPDLRELGERRIVIGNFASSNYGKVETPGIGKKQPSKTFMLRK